MRREEGRTLEIGRGELATTGLCGARRPCVPSHVPLRSSSRAPLCYLGCEHSSPCLNRPPHSLPTLDQCEISGDQWIRASIPLPSPLLSAEQWRRAAQTAREAGLPNQAVQCLNRVISRDKTDIEARITRANLLADIGDHARALTQFEQLRKMAPGDPAVVTGLAQVYYATKQSNKAIDTLEKFMMVSAQAVEQGHLLAGAVSGHGLPLLGGKMAS